MSFFFLYYFFLSLTTLSTPLLLATSTWSQILFPDHVLLFARFSIPVFKSHVPRFDFLYYSSDHVLWPSNLDSSSSSSKALTAAIHSWILFQIYLAIIALPLICSSPIIASGLHLQHHLPLYWLLDSINGCIHFHCCIMWLQCSWFFSFFCYI